MCFVNTDVLMDEIGLPHDEDKEWMCFVNTDVLMDQIGLPHDEVKK